MSHFHAVRFYETTESLCSVVAAFLGTGLVTNEPAVVIATPEHRSAIVAALRAVSFSVESLQASGKLLLLDAGDLLSTLMVNDTVDAVRFAGAATHAIGRVCTPQTRALRAYDEMVDLLWTRNQRAAAIRLETLWDRLTVAQGCSLLCGHAVKGLRDAGRQSVCAQHSHVLAHNGVPHPAR